MPNDETPNKVEAKKKRAFKFCPKCGSTDVFWAQGMPQFWSLWQCRKCGYRGALILENGNLALKLQEEWKKGFLSRNLDKAAMFVFRPFC